MFRCPKGPRRARPVWLKVQPSEGSWTLDTRCSPPKIPRGKRAAAKGAPGPLQKARGMVLQLAGEPSLKCESDVNSTCCLSASGKDQLPFQRRMRPYRLLSPKWLHRRRAQNQRGGPRACRPRVHPPISLARRPDGDATARIRSHFM